jgi:hypothetical protein
VTNKLLVAILALLVSHAAGGLASGLAGSLALAAAAGLDALGQVTSSDRLDSFHDKKPLKLDKISLSAPLAYAADPKSPFLMSMIARNASSVKDSAGRFSQAGGKTPPAARAGRGRSGQSAAPDPCARRNFYSNFTVSSCAGRQILLQYACDP